MRRELPPRPHLRHLKKQAKELLDAYRRADADAQQRVLDSLPALSGRSRAELEASPLALHDAQSVIAREYGFASWRELREDLEQRGARRAFETMIAEYIKTPLPPEVTAALTSSWSSPSETRARMAGSLPAWLPMLAVRDFFLTPRSITPLYIMRPVSLAALDAALATTPPLLAVFAQREPGIEAVQFDNLYPVGCQVQLRGRFDQPRGGTMVVVEGLGWIGLQELQAEGAGLRAHVTAVRTGSDEDVENERLSAGAEEVRERAKRLAKLALTESGPAIELIDSIEGPDHLADLVIANMKCPVEDKARYAEQSDGIERLRILKALLDGQLAALGSS